jgi:hypothetical protein
MSIYRIIIYNLFTALFIAVSALFISCEKTEYVSGDVKLSFSSDTVSFDTVFTSFGTAVRSLKVYNRYNNTVRISSITLANVDDSFFMLNIDGENTHIVKNVDLPPGDSLFMFITVLVDPLDSDNPVMINDSVVFETNGAVQDVKLIAYGQDVHLLKGDTLSSQTWTNDRPYLIYSPVTLDTGQTLIISAGSRVFFHKNASLNIYGTLIVGGTGEEPVIFGNDRTEDYYNYLPGQWGSIYIDPVSTGNSIKNAIIKNCFVGVQAGNPMYEGVPDVVIADCYFLNMAYAGIYASGAVISCSNTVLSGSAGNLLLIERGGKYNFRHCTFSNQGVEGAARKAPSVKLSNYCYFGEKDLQTGDIRYIMLSGDLDSATFVNCIVYGSFQQEIQFLDNGLNDFRYYFRNCLLKMPPDFSYLPDTSLFSHIVVNKDPEFINDLKNPVDLQLDTLSPAKDAGDPGATDLWPYLKYDIRGKLRTLDGKPDIGAYERKE